MEETRMKHGLKVSWKWKIESCNKYKFWSALEQVCLPASWINIINEWHDQNKKKNARRVCNISVS